MRLAAEHERGCYACARPPQRLLTPSFSHPRSCKQNQDLLSFYAVVMGLDNAAVSRLRLTWEVMRLLPSPLLRCMLAHLGILASSLNPDILGSSQLEGGALFWQIQSRAHSSANRPCPRAD